MTTEIIEQAKIEELEEDLQDAETHHETVEDARLDYASRIAQIEIKEGAAAVTAELAAFWKEVENQRAIELQMQTAAAILEPLYRKAQLRTTSGNGNGDEHTERTVASGPDHTNSSLNRRSRRLPDTKELHCEASAVLGVRPSGTIHSGLEPVSGRPTSTFVKSMAGKTLATKPIDQQFDLVA
jgi:hypothetical protein